MKQRQGLGTEQQRDREDRDENGIPDQSEFDFEEAGHTQPQPADRHPEHEPPRRERREHAG